MKGWLLVLVLGVAACTPSHRGIMSNSEDLSRLSFLEGKWVGTAPDGSPFYEQYDFQSPALFRSQRFSDETFSAAKDGSSVSIVDGEVISTWGEYTWKASELADGRACFVPLNAPSSFCWERVTPSTVHVIQKWKDAEGKEQSYTVKLQRVETR